MSATYLLSILALFSGLILGSLSAGAQANSAQVDSQVNSELNRQLLNAQADKGFLIAQWDGDESYDPFSDYSEFEETEEEEADINFFRNGRLFTMGLAVGYRGFTGQMANIYERGSGFGIFLTYFFDLRFAMQIGFLTGDSAITIRGPTTAASATGTLDLTEISFNTKYFLNTQNVTRGLAQLNPYIIGGVTQYQRTISLTDEVAFGKDSAIGVNLGAGIEIPMLRGKMFLGLEGNYSLVDFADEKKEIILDGDAVNGATGLFPAGDIYAFRIILGKNF